MNQDTHIVEPLTMEEIKFYVTENVGDHYVRVELAYQGKYLDILVNDEFCSVRRAVARQGYGLEQLVNDEYHLVRLEVARQGYGLDQLVYDENAAVRREAKYQEELLQKEKRIMGVQKAISTVSDLLSEIS